MKEDVLRFREVYNIWEGRGLDPDLLAILLAICGLQSKEHEFS